MAYRDTILADSPVSYWRLGDAIGAGTIADSKGTSNGSQVGLTQASGLIADADKAMSSDGVIGHYATVPNSGSLQPTNVLSLECWVSPVAWPGGVTFLGRIYASAQYFFTVNGQQVRWDVRDDQGSPYRVNSDPLAVGQTYHLVGVYDAPNSLQALYVNGVSQGSMSAVPWRNVNQGATPFTFFGNGPADYTLPGTLDEVAYYNYALTPAQVLAHYKAGAPPAATSIDASPAQATGSAPAPSVSAAHALDVLAASATGAARVSASASASASAASATANAPPPSVTGATGLTAPPARATASAAASGSVRSSAPQAGATGSAAATIGFGKGVDVGPASASASSAPPASVVTASAPQANATGTAPPPVVSTSGLGKVDIDINAAQGTARSVAPAIWASVSVGTAYGSSGAWNWSQALSTQPTAAFSTGQAPAPTVLLVHAVDVDAAGATGDAWPMSTSGAHVNVPGPPISAGRLVLTRSGHVARGSPGRVGTGPRQGVRA